MLLRSQGRERCPADGGPLLPRREGAEPRFHPAQRDFARHTRTIVFTSGPGEPCMDSVEFVDVRLVHSANQPHSERTFHPFRIGHHPVQGTDGGSIDTALAAGCLMNVPGPEEAGSGVPLGLSGEQAEP